VTPLVLIGFSSSLPGLLDEQIKKNIPGYGKWEKEAIKAGDALLESCLTGIEIKKQILREKVELIKGTSFSDYVYTRVREELDFLNEMGYEINNVLENHTLFGKPYLSQALNLARKTTVHAIVIQRELMDIKRLLIDEPSVGKTINISGRYKTWTTWLKSKKLVVQARIRKRYPRV
jgi:hypothetical protein